jgi:hypothetical protein
MVDYKLLLKILMEWSINSKEYETVLFIYKTFNIGIPVKFLYKLENKNMFFSLNSFVNNSHTKKNNNKELNELFELFKTSKYKKLIHWENKYGYSLKK